MTPTDTAADPQVGSLDRLEAGTRALRGELRSAEQQAEIRHRLACLEADNRALRDQLIHSQRLAALGTMAAMVAHEFNNILTPVIGYAQLAKKNPAMQEKALARAAEGSQRATDICQAILHIARDDAPEPGEVELTALIAETLMAMGRDPRRDGIQITLRAPADLRITTRKVEVQQVLLNLLLNARTAVLGRGEPRRIEIAADRCDDRVILRVQDNGVGIPPGNIGRIFEPFFTTHRDKGDGAGGHGLGLAVSREIIRSLHGEISVDSSPGRGATFTVSLPQ